MHLDVLENWVYHFARAGDKNYLLEELRTLDIHLWDLILADTDAEDEFGEPSRVILHMLDDATWELRVRIPFITSKRQY